MHNNNFQVPIKFTASTQLFPIHLKITHNARAIQEEEDVSFSCTSSNLLTMKLMLLLAYCLLFNVSIQAAADPQLTLDYYASSCPAIFDLIKKEMECAVTSDPRNAATVLRLHTHDCFVQGCDASILLDDTVTLKGEKTALQNKNSLKGFGIIDKIKNLVESECPGVVSCADILTVAARDAVVLVGGPYWDVPVGRKDSRTASYVLANTNIPGPNEALISIISKFLYQGLSVTDMVALAGAHTIGMARCESFRARIYGDFVLTSDLSAISTSYLSGLRSICPAIGSGGDNVTALDYATPSLFDNSYYQILLRGQGLLNSDQEMYSSLVGIGTRHLVHKYAEDPVSFFKQFADSMVKMGNIVDEDSFVGGEVRKNCRFVNSEYTEPQ